MKIINSVITTKELNSERKHDIITFYGQTLLFVDIEEKPTYFKQLKCVVKRRVLSAEKLNLGFVIEDKSERF